LHKVITDTIVICYEYSNSRIIYCIIEHDKRQLCATGIRFEFLPGLCQETNKSKPKERQFFGTWQLFTHRHKLAI